MFTKVEIGHSHWRDKIFTDLPRRNFGLVFFIFRAETGEIACFFARIEIAMTKIPKKTSENMFWPTLFRNSSFLPEFLFFGRGKANLWKGGILHKWLIASIHPRAHTPRMLHPFFGAKDVCYIHIDIEKNVAK